MVAGFWYNNDGLPIQYGTQKAIPEVGGDYLVYGETREIEQYIPLVPLQWTTAGQVVPAAPTSFSGTGNPSAAGILSLTTLFPLAQVAPVTSGNPLVFTAPQVFIEQVEVDTIIGCTSAGTVTLSVGLAVTSPASPSTFVQLTSSVGSAGQQILNAFPLVTTGAATVQGAVGGKTIYTGSPQGFTFNGTSGGVAVTTGGGSWTGIMSPIPTNAITPLPQAAWLSSIVTGTATGGLVKVRVKYVEVGNINY